LKSKSTISIIFQPGNRVVRASQEETLLEAALREKIELPHSCGGHGTCGTCRVFVLEGLEKLSPRNEIEAEFADERGFQSNERLCCQNYPVSGLVLKIPDAKD
jgi:2Fe-2S ferredoxin